MIEAANLKQLEKVSPRARKLLAQAAELAYHGRGQDRGPDTAYLPEVYESSGLSVEEMYELLDELKGADLITLEGEYPFEDMKLDRLPLGEIEQRCRERKVALRDVLVDLEFDRIQ